MAKSSIFRTSVGKLILREKTNSLGEHLTAPDETARVEAQSPRNVTDGRSDHTTVLC